MDGKLVDAFINAWLSHHTNKDTEKQRASSLTKTLILLLLLEVGHKYPEKIT